MNRKAIVIGAGFGGLALAVRLQSAGIDTTLIEARDRPGGCAYMWEKDGFVFDAGPTVITDPDCLGELWRLSGRDMAEDVDLVPVSPFCRLNWRDGTNFDYSSDDTALRAQIAKLNPEDVSGYERFLAYADRAYEEGYRKLGVAAFPDFAAMVRAAPGLARSQAWRSIHSVVSSHVKNEKLRQALSFHTLLRGGNPLKASAIHALTHKLERDGGVWFAKGGTNRLVQAMATHFERLGGMLRLADPAVQIETYGDRAVAVRTASGWRGEADVVASNADLMHSYRDLIGHHPRGQKQADRLGRKRWSPSLFVLHFGIRGSWPGIPHNMVLFGPRYEGLLTDIYDYGVLPQDFALYLHHPTVTDPSMAPDGHSTFSALAPVPHLGKLPIDWSQFAPVYAERILDEIQHRLIPDIRARIVTQFHYAPPDFRHDLSAHLGSAFSLEPTLSQSAWFRAHHRDDVIPNLYLVGAGTHPGAGIAGVVGSAKATAALMLEDLA
ncbi:phytoene desaturase [Sphingobium estronivorans]|uniref:phytoene desaturase n=1 Tax=Sphingobium estronivorans TaxID=1577690 RepID=UPI001238E811|nr:phytoene desaturase [Sphingobium estronivorans]